MKYALVMVLARTCEGVDRVLYQPWAVGLTRRLPLFWHCHLAELSGRLEARWGTDYWTFEPPEGLCVACHRRAAWLYHWVEAGIASPFGPAIPVEDISDFDAEERQELAGRTFIAIKTCGWCEPDLAYADSPGDVGRRLKDAGLRSMPMQQGTVMA